MSNLDNSALTPANNSTIASPMGSFPGGPSPDSQSTLSPHAKPMNTRRPAAASTDDTTRSYLPPQPFETPTTGTRGHTFSDEHPEIAPAVRVAAAPNSEEANGLLRKEEGSATRRTNRSQRTNDVGAKRADAAGTFTAANGPSEVDPSQRPRSTIVDDEPSMQMATIGKEEHGVSRKLSKFEKRGAKAEKAALHVALQELAEIQELQTASIKEEAVFHSRHSRALSDAHKAEMELLAARTSNERGQASLQAAGEVLEASRKHARETTKMLHDKMAEVDSLRTHKKVNDKDRAIKVKGSIGHRLGRILGSQ